MSAIAGVLASAVSDVSVSHAPDWFMAVLTVAALSVMVLRRHFDSVSRRTRMADPANPHDAPGLQKEPVERLDPEQPLAVFLVGGENRLEPMSIRVFAAACSKDYRQILFISVGLFDYEVMDAGVGDGGYADPEKAKHLRMKTRLALDPYLAVAHELGLTADCRVSVATNPVEEIDRMSTQLVRTYPRAVFFVSRLVFRRFHWFRRWFQSGTSEAIQRLLEKKGLPVTVIPLVLPM